jgi:hypothetical protein
MNPWLITWESMSKRASQGILNRIAAILPCQTSEREIKKILYLLLANHWAASGKPESVYVSEQVRFAKRDYPHKAQRHLFPEISCGGNPFLFARPVYDLTIEKDEEGFEVLRWQQLIYPYPPRGVSASDWVDEIERKRPFKRRRKVFNTKTNTITKEQ